MKYEATHILKKDFVVSGYEMYKKGTPVAFPRTHRRHEGFCCSAALLSKNGTILVNKPSLLLALFDKEHFTPQKDWLTPVEKKPIPFNPKHTIWKKLTRSERERLCDAEAIVKSSIAFMETSTVKKKAIIQHLKKASRILEEFMCP